MAATHGEGVYGNAVGVTTPVEHKMAQVGPILKTGVNTIRPGLFWDGNPVVVTGRANMAYDVRAFTIATTRGATAGAVPWSNDAATTNLATTAAPGSNSRIDIVYAWHREFALDGTNSDPVIGVIQGTAAASPTAPSLAAFPGAVELARVTVPAGITATTSATITQTAPFTTTADGTPVFRTTTEMNTYTPLKVGDLAWCIADSSTYRWNGTAWKIWNTTSAISYVPTLTGFGGSAPTISASYTVTNGKYDVDGSVTLVSGTTLTANPTATLPVSMAASYPSDAVLGRDRFSLVAGGNYPLITSRSSASAIVNYAENASGTYLSISSVGASVPATWATGSVWRYHAEYWPA